MRVGRASTPKRAAHSQTATPSKSACSRPSSRFGTQPARLRCSTSSVAVNFVFAFGPARVVGAAIWWSQSYVPTRLTSGPIAAHCSSWQVRPD
jgi:hypothetical protein